jgi:hypothetical protein
MHPPVLDSLASVVQTREPDGSRQYSRNFPLKLSTNEFCVGFPGWMKCSFTPTRCDQRKIVGLRQFLLRGLPNVRGE